MSKAGEIAQRVLTLAAKAEHLSWILRMHMME